MIASGVRAQWAGPDKVLKTAIDTPLDTGPERMGEEDPPFHKKQEPLKISVKIIRGKIFLVFLRCGFLK